MMAIRNNGDDGDRRRKRVADIFEYASTPRRRSGSQKPSAEVAVSGNIITGNNNSFTVIKTERVVRKEIAIPQPGTEHITEAQMGKLHALVSEIVRVETLTKREPATFQRVWGALRMKMKVGSNRMIPVGKFSMAERYLQQWLGRLSGTAAAQKEDDGLRSRRIKYIQTNMRKLGFEERVRGYMDGQFHVSSLSDLSIEQIEKVYRYVAGLKKSLGS
ncbi:hypothetical protein [Azospirillum agricola]|uniref:hypothetical protein n=1 Tax=Azospirillum agricola TaxID=1720247 RepID=UPI000A0F0E43|nr:hypothetical protein [Azospirillum agricola]SMH62879.1 hypothetical protein SAMN02982994_6702 [Azospirillum lipoferum]